jgi:hypothetical protein
MVCVALLLVGAMEAFAEQLPTEETAAQPTRARRQERQCIGG